MINKQIRFFLYFFILLCVPIMSYGQYALTASMDHYITYRSGMTYGLGLNQFSNRHAVSFKIKYVNLSNYRYPDYIAIDGGSSANGIGLHSSYFRFAHTKRKGLFIGMGVDFNFLKNKHFSFPNEEWNTNSIEFIPSLKTGYGISISEKYYAIPNLSLGMQRDTNHFERNYHFLLLIGIEVGLFAN